MDDLIFIENDCFYNIYSNHNLPSLIGLSDPCMTPIRPTPCRLFLFRKQVGIQ